MANWSSGIYCACGHQWHGCGHIEKREAVIRWHANKHGLISHYQFHLKFTCECSACRAIATKVAAVGA
jgi:hypothetical protein